MSGWAMRPGDNGAVTTPFGGATVEPMRDPAVGWVRLLVRLPTRVEPPDRRAALIEALDRHVGPADALGAPWVTEPLFSTAQPDNLARWWTAGGAVPSVVGYDVSRIAYDLATLLAGEPGFVVEPDLPSSAYGRDVAIGTPDVGVADAELPCSDAATWALDAVRAPDAWALPSGDDGHSRGEGVLIGHIDTGWTDHPELDGSLDLDLDRNVLDHTNDARDPLVRSVFGVLDSAGHGTSTGSVVASRPERVVVGVAPNGTLVPIRAIRSVVQVLDSAVARAVDVARRRGCHIITMALGGRGFLGLRDAIRTAVADGMIVMAAAGNHVGFVVAPASYPECIAVGATNCASRPWSGSSHGRAVTISAPGASVWSAGVVVGATPPEFVVGRSSGTSFAVSALAGVAALWLAHHGPDRIRERYGASTQDAFLTLLHGQGHRVPPGWVSNGWAEDYGVGIVDAVGLLGAPLPDLPLAVPAKAPRPTNVVARLQSALSALSAEQVNRRVGDLVGSVDDLPATVVSELVYRLGEDEQLRAAVLDEPTDLVTAAGTATTTAGALLRRTASRALLDAVGR